MNDTMWQWVIFFNVSVTEKYNNFNARFFVWKYRNKNYEYCMKSILIYLSWLRLYSSEEGGVR